MGVAVESMATTVRATNTNAVRTTFPAALARETRLRERVENGVTYDLRRGRDGENALELVVRFGADVDPDAALTIPPTVRDRQVELELPRFWAHSWGLPGCSVAWPDSVESEGVTVGGETVTIRAPVEGWTPAVSIDVFEATGEVRETVLSESGAEGLVEGSVPVGAARRVGLLEDGTNGRVAFDRVDGRAVFTLSPTERAIEGNPDVLSVEPHGHQDGQARFYAAKIATVLGVRDRLREESVGIRWWVGADGYVVGFVAE